MPETHSNIYTIYKCRQRFSKSTANTLYPKGSFQIRFKWHNRTNCTQNNQALSANGIVINFGSKYIYTNLNCLCMWQWKKACKETKSRFVANTDFTSNNKAKSKKKEHKNMFCWVSLKEPWNTLLVFGFASTNKMIIIIIIICIKDHDDGADNPKCKQPMNRQIVDTNKTICCIVVVYCVHNFVIDLWRFCVQANTPKKLAMLLWHTNDNDPRKWNGFNISRMNGKRFNVFGKNWSLKC